MTNLLAFRPHHFLCALCFQGKGYSKPFIANFTAIMEILNTAEETNIQVVKETDSLCQPCPHRQGQRCETEAKIALLDHAHADALHIKVGDILTWKDAKKRIRDTISLPVFDQICATCEWKPLGLCETVVKSHIA